MSNELATQGQQLPAHIAALAKPGNAYADKFGQMENSDIRLNMIKVAYPGSPQCTEPGWGPTGSEPILQPMQMYLSRSGQVIPPESPFLPLLRSTRYIHWEGRPGNGRMVFSTTDKNDQRIREFVRDPKTGRWLSGLDFPKNASGETLAPPVTCYINFFLLIKNVPWPVLMSFKRTSTPAGHQFTSDLLMATMTANGRIPMYALRFKLLAPKVVVDGVNTYYHFAFQADGFTSPERLEQAAQMSALAESINSVTTENELEGGDAEPENLKQATPTTVTVSAPPTVQAPVTLPTVQAAVPPPPAPTISVPPAPVAPPAIPSTPTASAPANADVELW